MNQATAEHQKNHIKESLYTWFGFQQGPDRDRGTVAIETCEYYVNKDGRPILGSLTCKRDLCINTFHTPSPDSCYNVYKISPKPTGGIISPPPPGLTEEMSPGSEALPPSIAPGDSGTENNNETEKNMSQNTRKVPKDLGGLNNDNGLTINPGEK